jgi:hypothetical protein
MNLKKTLIRTAVLIFVLVGLGSYFYFYEFKAGKEREKAEEEAKKVFQLDEDKVVELRLARADEEQIVCTKEDDKWRVEQPVQADADQSAVDRVVSEFVDVKRTRTVEEEPQDLAPFGLDEPSLKLAALVEEKDAPETLLLGNENPTKSAFYAKTETDTAVFLIQSHSKRSLDKKLFDLRDKKVADFVKDDVQALQMERGELKIEAQKQDDGTWMLASPLEVRGDKTEITETIDKINSARVKEFIDEEPVDLAEYGLDIPDITLTMLIGEDKASKALLIGRKNEDKDGYYAKRAEEKNVFLLKQDLLDAIPEQVDTWRDHSLLTVNVGKVEKMEYLADGQKFVLATDEERDWQIKEPIEEKADDLVTNDLITDLTNVKAKEFLTEEEDEFGFAEPQIALKLWVKEVERPVTVIIGAKDEEQNVVYARNMDGTAVTVDEADLDKIKKSLFDFRDKVLVSFDKRDVQRLTVRYGEDELVLAQKDEKWTAEKPDRFKIRNQSDVDTLVWVVNYLTMEEIAEEEKPEDLSKYGLDKPRAEFSVALAEDKTVGPFLIGGSSEGKVYVVTAEKRGVYLINASVLDDLKRDLGMVLDKTLPSPADLLKPAEEAAQAPAEEPAE